MRMLITGIDANGRSCVIEETSFDESALEGAYRHGHGAGSARVYRVYETSGTPPARPVGRGKHTDLGVPPGTVRWIRVQLPPADEDPQSLSHTDTVDFDTIISGCVDLIFDDGPHRLNPGDCVVVAG